MSRREKNDNPLSLFSFQDVITGITGIMILIVLMLVHVMQHLQVVYIAQVQIDLCQMLVVKRLLM